MKKESLRRRKKNRKVKYILQMNTNDHLFSDNLLCASLGHGFSCLLDNISFQETKIHSHTLFLQMNTNDLSANSLCASLGCEFSCRPSLEVPSSPTHPHLLTVFYLIFSVYFPYNARFSTFLAFFTQGGACSCPVGKKVSNDSRSCIGDKLITVYYILSTKIHTLASVPIFNLLSIPNPYDAQKFYSSLQMIAN